MREVTITLRPLPGVAWIRDDIAFGTSVVFFKAEVDSHASPLTLIGVDLNGTPLEFRVVDAHTVELGEAGRERQAGWSLPREGGRLQLRFLAPFESLEPRKGPLATTPPAPISYGLQAPSYPWRKATP